MRLVTDRPSNPRAHARPIESGPRSQRRVALTFDDGPLRPYTTPILKALDAHCTKATFFQVGKMAIADPEMVREIERRGHRSAATPGRIATCASSRAMP